MNLLRKIPAAVVASALALSLAPALAQEEEPGALDDFSQFEGVEYAVSRTWSVDLAAMMEITPEDEGADPFAEMSGLWFIVGSVVELEDDSDAEAMFEYFREIEDEEFLADVEDPDTEVIREDLDDIGDQAHAVSFAATGEDTEGYYRFSFAQAGEYVFYTVAIAFDEDSVGRSDDLLAYLADQDDHSGLGNYDPDATDVTSPNTDGLWEFFPDDDEEFLNDLIFASDEVLYPVEEDEGA